MTEEHQGSEGIADWSLHHFAFLDCERGAKDLSALKRSTPSTSVIKVALHVESKTPAGSRRTPSFCSARRALEGQRQASSVNVWSLYNLEVCRPGLGGGLRAVANCCMQGSGCHNNFWHAAKLLLGHSLTVQHLFIFFRKFQYLRYLHLTVCFIFRAGNQEQDPCSMFIVIYKTKLLLLYCEYKLLLLYLCNW